MISTDQFKCEFIPAEKYRWRRRPKLMIVLHGRGDSTKPFRQLPEELELPEMNYLLLNAPRKYDGGYSWFGLEPNHKKGILRSRERLHHLIEDLELQGWRTSDIFLFGLSQGCLMACDLAMTYPKPFAGLIGVSGYLWLFEKWKAKVSSSLFHTPWIMTHGFDDEDIPIEETRAQIKKLWNAGLRVEWMEMVKGHEVETTFEAPMLGRWVRRQVVIKSKLTSKTKDA